MRISDWSSDVCSSDLLTLQHTVDAAYLLLFAQLGAVIGQTSATLTVNTRRGFDIALGFERARTTLQEEIGAFTTRQFALGTNITSHSSLSPDYTRRFFGEIGRAHV